MLLLVAFTQQSSAQLANNDDPFNENIQFNEGGANTFSNNAFYNGYGGGLGQAGGNGFARSGVDFAGRGRRMLRQPVTTQAAATAGS
ncbi:MAG: hypothetical protein WDW36_009190 [Sanguina aurantia]